MAGVECCSLALQLGFFYCRERNIIENEDSDRLTNTGRLYKALPGNLAVELNSSNVNFSVFVPEPGTRQDVTDTHRLHILFMTDNNH